MTEKLMVNPWTRMWIKPKETIRAIVTYNPRFRFISLCIINGLPTVFQFAQSMSLGSSYPALGIILGSLFMSIFVGMIALTIASGLVYMTGKWIGGTASFLEVRCAISWGNLPGIVSILMWSVLFGMFGKAVFTGIFDTATFTQSESIILMGIFLIQTVATFWSLFLVVQSVAEVQGFYSWKAVLNLLLSFGIFLAAMWVLGLFFVGE